MAGLPVSPSGDYPALPRAIAPHARARDTLAPGRTCPGPPAEGRSYTRAYLQAVTGGASPKDGMMLRVRPKHFGTQSPGLPENPSPTTERKHHGHEEKGRFVQGQRQEVLKPNASMDLQIADMLAEIAKDIHRRKVTDDSDPAYGAYFAAQIELEMGQPPNLPYVHNVLAAALCRPYATRH